MHATYAIGRVKNVLKNSRRVFSATGIGRTTSPSSIVSACAALTAGHAGNPAPLGSPVLAKFTQ